MPTPRAGHSASYAVDPSNGQDIMIVYGGKDDENQKLADLWKFNFVTRMWEELIPRNEPEMLPVPRSGHSAAIYNNELMIVFGGIYEITRELNDCHVYSLKDNVWYSLFEETGPASPVKAGLSGMQSFKNRNALESSETTRKSPTIKKSKTVR